MRVAPVAIWLCTGLLALAVLRAGGSTTADTPRLPGARPEITAADYPSLQAAIDAVGAEGGVVRIPPGHFELDEPLVVTSPDLLIVGAGTATHIHNRNDEGKPAIVLKAADLEEKPNSRVWRIKLADFRLTGNPRSGHGVEATGVNELYLDGITVSEHGGDGVRMTDCYEDPRIVGCLFTYNKQVGVNLIGCHDIVVSANQFEENQDALRCADGFNLCMTGNCVDDHLRHGVVVENTYGSVVSGNMIEECAGTAIVLSRDCYGITLSANVIAHETGGGIDLQDAHGCAVSANTFTIVKANALRIGPDSGRITVTGNNFSDSTIGPGEVKRGTEDRTASGILLEGTRDVAISGNLFSGLSTAAVEAIDSPERILLDGNVFTDVQAGTHLLKNSVLGDKIR